MQLNSVVLPAPFGPISPHISPSATSKAGPSKAKTPPKRTTTSLICSTLGLHLPPGGRLSDSPLGLGPTAAWHQLARGGLADVVAHLDANRRAGLRPVAGA